METLDSNAWVFDSLVGFLHGPIWNVPLQTFIEEKSLPFEPTDNGEVLDRPEYQKIHDEYRNLVDVMLSSFMDDIGITADQFEAACQLSARNLAGLPSHFHRRLFEQIWAANDYDIFVKMMTHKNVELQLQALELIERRYGALPSLFSSDIEDLDTSRSEESDIWPDTDEIMSEIKKLQLDDVDIQETLPSVPQDEVVAEKLTLLSKLQNFEKKEEESLKRSPTPVKKSSPVAIETPKPPPPKKVEVSDEEIKKRQEYLKQQRDKLLALKKQVRERRLGDSETGNESGGGEGSKSHKARPKSAKTAHAALAGAPPPPPPDAMQLRKALASKLKTEVVDLAN